LNFLRYFILSRGPKAIEELKNNFTEVVNTNAKNVVYSHALLSVNATHAESLRKYFFLKVENIEIFTRSGKFRDLSASVPTNQYMSCFQTVLEVMCDIMFSHYTIYQWHVTVR
jgi:hypothetical protein